MEKKTFSKIEIAVIKRTAQNVAQFVTKKEKLNAKIAELEAEKASLQPIIDSFQGPIKEMTGGYTTEDLVTREVVHTGKMDSKTGKEILQTRYVLKYPENVIPPVFVPSTADGPGSDYDVDVENLQQQAAAEGAIDAQIAEENADPFNEESWG